eukprot:GHVS01070698.1.p1 GENE.GHVS01070698.1~~GHVS01070698.1.p1  ORF type:complete len:118 (-),score=3.84 GHVS01070698.1:303-656(-)
MLVKMGIVYRESEFLWKRVCRFGIVRERDSSRLIYTRGAAPLPPTWIYPTHLVVNPNLSHMSIYRLMLCFIMDHQAYRCRRSGVLDSTTVAYEKQTVSHGCWYVDECRPFVVAEHIH